MNIIQDIINQLPSPAYWQNENGMLLYCNDLFVEYLGLDNKQTVIEHHFSDFLIKSNAEMIVKKNIEVMCSNGALIQERYATYENGSFTSLSYKFPLVIENEMLGIINICLSPEKIENEQMSDGLKAVMYLNNIVRNMPGSVYWKDKNGVFLGCNDFVVKMAGLNSQNDIIGKSDYELVWADIADQIRKNDLEIMCSKKSKELEEVVTLFNGEKILMLTNKAPLFDNDNNVIGIIGVSIDITARKKAEQDKLRAEQASSAKSEFIENMSHDIRTPLTGIVGMAHILKKNIHDPRILHDVGLMVHSSEELLNLLNEILSITKTNSGHIKQEPVEFSIKDIIDHNVNLVASITEYKKLEMRINIGNTVPSRVIGNKVLIDRILLNLISNAIKFTEQGSIEVKVNSTPCSKEDGINSIILQIVVKDTGIGIPADRYDFIFESFSRLNPSYQGIYKGVGLGLYTVKRHLEILGGTVKVESIVGSGSSFIIAIPLRAIEGVLFENESTTQSTPDKVLLQKEVEITRELQKSALAENVNVRTPHILLVEDSMMPAIIATQLLTDADCTVDHAKTGHEAIQKAKEGNYDLIYMDIGLPDIDGIEATKIIRQTVEPLKAKTPIIALTAHVEDDKKDNCFAVDMQEVVIKPLTKEIIDEMLEKYVSQSQMSRKNKVTDTV